MSGLEGNSIFQKVIHKEHKKNPPLPAGGYFSVEEASTFIVI
jgi:hypothetical protein